MRNTCITEEMKINNNNKKMYTCRGDFSFFDFFFTT